MGISTLRFPDRLFDAYIFDMDGTIYLGDEILPGVKRLMDFLQEREIPIRFLSNNPTKTPQQYVQKLAGLGIETTIDNITNTIVTLISWIKKNHPTAVVFPIAEAPLISALDQAGIRISEDPKEIDIVVASYDRTLNYQKLKIAFDAIWYYKRAKLIATNPDKYCPLANGQGEPDCAVVIAAIEACTGVQCAAIMGKPEGIMLKTAISGLNVKPENCLMVGDRLHTDVEMAKKCGLWSALPLTGDTKIDEITKLELNKQPDFILDRIDRLIPNQL